MAYEAIDIDGRRFDIYDVQLIAAFEKLPLNIKMLSAATILEDVNREAERPGSPSMQPWSAHSLREYSTKIASGLAEKEKRDRAIQAVVKVIDDNNYSVHSAAAALVDAGMIITPNDIQTTNNR